MMKQNRGYKKGDQMKFPIVFLFFSFIYLQAGQPPRKPRSNSFLERVKAQHKKQAWDDKDFGPKLPESKRTNPHLANLKKKSPAFGN